MRELISEGFDYFISGGAIGVDQDFAEIVLELKKYYPHKILSAENFKAVKGLKC